MPIYLFPYHTTKSWCRDLSINATRTRTIYRTILSYLRGNMMMAKSAETCIFYVYWTVHHLHSWIKRDQLDVTCFTISLFNAQHVSDVVSVGCCVYGTPCNIFCHTVHGSNHDLYRKSEKFMKLHLLFKVLQNYGVSKTIKITFCREVASCVQVKI